MPINGCCCGGCYCLDSTTLDDVESDQLGVTVDTSTINMIVGGSAFPATFPSGINSQIGYGSTTTGTPIVSQSGNIVGCCLQGVQQYDNEFAIELVITGPSGVTQTVNVVYMFTSTKIICVIAAGGAGIDRGVILFYDEIDVGTCCGAYTLTNTYTSSSDFGTIIPNTFGPFFAGTTDFIVAGFGGTINANFDCPDAP